jgi:hypothetical protein
MLSAFALSSNRPTAVGVDSSVTEHNSCLSVWNKQETLLNLPRSSATIAAIPVSLSCQCFTPDSFTSPGVLSSRLAGIIPAFWQS